jgi:prepilin-type processing-associated H-X9-DG protein
MIATVTLLVIVLCRAGAGLDPATGKLQCLENLRRLTVAWSLYAEEHRGTFVHNSDAVGATPGWVSGFLDWTVATDNTNTARLTESRYSLLAPYTAGDATLFKCPADVYLSPAQVARGWTERVRSYSMNFFVGPPTSAKDGFYPGYRIFTRLSDFRAMAPAQTFLFLEEHPDSINDPLFIPTINQPSWLDVPASYHLGGCSFAFVDGHVELKQWQSARTVVPVRYLYTPINVPSNDPDYLWMKARATERQ